MLGKLASVKKLWPLSQICRFSGETQKKEFFSLRFVRLFVSLQTIDYASLRAYDFRDMLTAGTAASPAGIAASVS